MSVAEPAEHRSAGRWGHFGGQLLILSIVGLIALGLISLPHHSVTGIVIPFGIFAFAFATWVAMRRHDRVLCERCVRAMPLDAAATAARFSVRFSVAHAGEHRLAVLLYLVVLLSSNAGLYLGIWGRVVWAAVYSTMIYLVLAYMTHRRLQPWCPRCRGGEWTTAPSLSPDLNPAV